MWHVSNNFPAFLWLLNVFFVLIMIRSYWVHLLSKICLRMHCNFTFWIFSSSFFRHRTWRARHQMIFQCFYDYWISFHVLTMIRSYEVHFLSETCLEMHCNFKFWICSNSFLGLGHNRGQRKASKHSTQEKDKMLLWLGMCQKKFSNSLIAECRFLCLS